MGGKTYIEDQSSTVPPSISKFGNRITLSMMSNKYIIGGSKIIVRAPKGFTFHCRYFATDPGLASTTTCFVQTTVTPSGVLRNKCEFMIDSQDPKPERSPFKIFVYVANPEFTPQPNTWDFTIIGPLGNTIDMREAVPGFDVTGEIFTRVDPNFPYKSETNKISVIFLPTTIMNQADDGNELVLTAPPGYVFPLNCSSWSFRLTTQPTVPPGTSLSSPVFPPAGTTCRGTDSNVVVITLPSGAGLSINNYTLAINVNNPASVQNSTTWTFLTRVVNPTVGIRIVDVNRTIQGFDLKTIVPVDKTESAAQPRRISAAWCLVILAVVQFAGRLGVPAAT